MLSLIIIVHLLDPNPSEQFHHWIVGNIPMSNVTVGKTIIDFIGAAPPPETGFHLYVFLVYQQPGKLKFDEPRVENRC